MDQTTHTEPIKAEPAADSTTNVGTIAESDTKEPIVEAVNFPKTPTPTLASGRSQRVRKLPKRWEDANIQIFSPKSAKNNNTSNNNSTNSNNNSDGNNNNNPSIPTTGASRRSTKANKDHVEDEKPPLVARSHSDKGDNDATPAQADKPTPIDSKGLKTITKIVKVVNVQNAQNALKAIKVRIIKKGEADNKDSSVKTEEPLKDESKSDVKEDVKDSVKDGKLDKDIQDIKKEEVVEEKACQDGKMEVEEEEDKCDAESDANSHGEDAGAIEQNDDPDFELDDQTQDLWCICRKPYDNRFMICCDCCEEWFHGKCVGVTQQQNRKIEREKLEWFCPPCEQGIKQGTERSLLKQQATTKREQLEAQEKAAAKANKAAKFEEAKEKIVEQEPSAKERKSTDHNETLKKSPVKETLKRKAPKVEIERVKAKELKKSAMAAKAALNERMLKLQLPVSTSDSEKSKTADQEIPKPSSAKQLLVSPPIVSPTKKKHYKEFQDASLNELFKVDPVLNRSLSTSAMGEAPTVALERRNSSSSVNVKVERRKSLNATVAIGSKREQTESFSGEKAKVKPSPETKPSVHRNSVSSTTPPTPTPNRADEKKAITQRRDYFRNRILEIFIERYKKRTNKELSPVQENSLRTKAKEIEHEFYRVYRSDSKKYCNKLRSLLSNLMNTKNELYRKVILDKISVEKLAAMTVEELASSELAKWREQEKKKDIEMIKRDQEEQASMVSSVTKKTHKGDVMVNADDETVLDTGNGNDPADSTTAFIDDDDPLSTAHLQPISHIIDPATSSIHAASTSESVSGTLSAQASFDDPKDKEVFDEDVCEVLGIGKRIRTTSASSSVSGSISENVSMEEASISSASNSGNASTPLEGSKKPVTVVDVSTQKLDQEIEKLLNSHQQHHHLPTTPLLDEDHSNSQLPVYCGEVHMPDVGTFNVKALTIGGKISGAFKSSVSGSVNIQGRADPFEVWDYVQKLMLGKKTEFGLIRLFADKEQESIYNDAFEYLHHRSRYGVVKIHGKFYRDVYLVPLGESEDVPEALTSIPGFRIEPKNHRPNMLLILLIKIKSSGSIDHHMAVHSHEHHSGHHCHHHEPHSTQRANEEAHSDEKRKKSPPVDDEPYIPESVSTKRLKTSDIDDMLEPMGTPNNDVVNQNDPVYEPEVSDPRLKSSVSMSFTQQDSIIMTATTQTFTPPMLNNHNSDAAVNDAKKIKDFNLDLEKIKDIHIPTNLVNLFANKNGSNNSNNNTGNCAAIPVNSAEGLNFHSSQTIVHHDGSPLSNFANDHNYQPLGQHPSFGALHHEMHAYNEREPSHSHHPPAGTYPPPPHHYGREPPPHEMPAHHQNHGNHGGHHHYPPPHHPHPPPPHGFDGRTTHPHQPPRGHTPPPPPHHEHRPYGEHDEHGMHPQPPYPNHHHHHEGRDLYFDGYAPRGRGRGRGGRGGPFNRAHGGGRFIKRGGPRWDGPRY